MESEGLEAELEQIVEALQTFARRASSRLRPPLQTAGLVPVELHAVLVDFVRQAGSLDLHNVVRAVTKMVERAVIGEALTQSKGNKREASRLLGVDYKTARMKIKELGL